MRSMLLALAVFAGTLCSQASAQTINGTYTFRLTSNCQAMIRMMKVASGEVVDLAMSLTGKIEETIGTASFNDAANQVRILGFSVEGDLVRIAGKRGVAMKERVVSVTWPYSNTASSLTINGLTYRMVTAETVGGIVGHAFFSRRTVSKPGSKTGDCAVSGSAVKK